MYASQAFLLALAAASSYAQFSCVPDCRYPLPRNVENIRYELHVQPYFPADGIKVDPDKDYTFDGFVRIHFRVNSFAQNVSLDHLNLTLHSVGLYRNNAGIDVGTVVDKKTARLVVLPGELFVPTFNYTIEVSYTGLINDEDKGVAYSSYTNAKNGTSFMIHTQFEPRDARRLLPCFDDPHFKAVFKLTLTYPKGYTALSNTRPRTKLATNESFVSTTFHRTQRMSTYLLAFAIGKLASAVDFTSGREVPDSVEFRNYLVVTDSRIFFVPTGVESAFDVRGRLQTTGIFIAALNGVGARVGLYQTMQCLSFVTIKIVQLLKLFQTA